MKKIVITVLAVVAVLAIAVIFAFHRTDQRQKSTRTKSPFRYNLI